VYPEVEKYLNEVKDIEQEYTETRKQNRAHRYDRSVFKTEDDFYAAMNATHQRWAERQNAAWDALGKATSDPLLTWMVENLSDYRPEAGVIMVELPATPERLREVALGRGWCSEFDELYDKAVQAGVMAPEPARSRLAAYLEGLDDLWAAARTEILRLADAMVAEVKKED
jgi:hypothetical protein